MRNRITALGVALALSAGAAHAQLRGDTEPEPSKDETVNDPSVEAAVRAAAEARNEQASQPAGAERADAAVEDAEVVVDGERKGEPVEVDAEAIEAAVRTSLNMSTPIEQGQIEVSARDDGTVTLSGPVASEAQKQLVETVASNAPAVRELRSRLVVREPGQPPPETPPVDN